MHEGNDGIRLSKSAHAVEPMDGQPVPASWNETADPIDDTLTLVDLVEAGCTRNPERIALTGKRHGDVTYGELWRKARLIANWLGERGMGPGSHVGLLIEHSPWAVIGILGVLTSGAAYVPLDPRWPAARIASPLARLRITHVLTSRALARLAEESSWQAGRELTLLCLDADSTPVDPIDDAGVAETWDDIAHHEDLITAAGFNIASSDALSASDVAMYLDRVASLLPDAEHPLDVLEIGCGVGLLPSSAKAHIGTYWGIDPSKVALRRCETELAAHGITTELRQGYAHQLSEYVQDEAFDVVLIASTVHLFPGPDYARHVLRDAVSCLHPGGRLVVADVVDAEDAGASFHAGHLGLPKTWFQQALSDLPVTVVVLDREKARWPTALASRFDVVITRLAECTLVSPERLGTWTWTWPQAIAGRNTSSGCEIMKPSADETAYVIFTSGSTGEPKGVAVSHRSVVNLITWVNTRYEVVPDDRLLLVTSFSFDLSVYDVLGMLSAGGSICILSEDELEDPARVLDELDRGAITFWDSAPAALSQVMAEAEIAALPRDHSRLRLVFLSGDWVPLTLPDRVRDRYPAARVVALGGATEATIWSNYFEVGEVDASWPSIPYGRPIANARYYVLDSHQVPTRVGEPGDLYIAGLPVAEGYEGDPALTSQRFLVDPFVPAGPCARMYATGDRARWLPDGNLQFLGRLDEQVKVRGFRVELGDVTAALLRIPGVVDAITLKQDGPSGPVLLAAVVGSVDVVEVRRQAFLLLPAYMVPGRIGHLPSLPVSNNGKVDRKAVEALLLSASPDMATRSANVAPDPLVHLVRLVLGREDVNTTDSFISAGGHSLAAVHLRSLMLQRHGWDVRVSEILGADSIAEIAELARPGAVINACRVPGQRQHPISRAQNRALFEISLSPEVGAYQNQVTIRFGGGLAPERLVDALEDLVASFPVLRSRLHRSEGEWVVTTVPPARPDVEFVDLSKTAAPGRDAEIASHLAEHWGRGWDLERKPLVTWVLFRLTSEEILLSQVEHHLIHDGWSLTLLVGHLARHLGGRDREPPAALGYAEYVAHESAYADSGERRQDVEEYAKELAGSPSPPVAPEGDLRVTPEFVGPARGACVTKVVPAGHARALTLWASKEGITLFELLFTVFLDVLRQASGETDLVVGSAVSARPAGFEDTAGMFVNTVAIRAHWQPSFKGFLHSVSRSFRLARDKELLPLDEVLSAVRRIEGSQRHGLYRCMFSAHDAPMPDLSAVAGLPVELSYHQNSTAKLPLDVLVIPKQSDADPCTPDGAVRLLWEFDETVFSAAQISSLASALVDALGSLVAHVSLGPLLSNWQLPRLAPAEILPPPKGDCGGEVPVLADMACRVATPDHVLDLQECRSNRFSAMECLTKAGVVPGHVVAVDATKSIRHIARILAILQLGAVVMPVDPEWPRSRRDEALRHAHYQWGDQDPLSMTPWATRLELQSQRAYLVHTSGTTGRPKPVSVSRVVLESYLSAFVSAIDLRPDDVLLGMNSAAFDACFEEVLAVASVGATLVLPGAGLGVAALMEEIERRNVTVLDLPTALWHVIADHLEDTSTTLPRTVRAVVIGGEAYDPRRAERFVSTHGQRVQLFSMYGPAECGISVTIHRLDPSSVGSKRPELGRPIPHVHLRVVDQEGGVVPLGRSGYLRISGLPADQLDPSHEQEVGDDGFRYTTSDLVLLTPEGRLLFLGRGEDVLKISGFRVSATEVETHAARCPGVRGAVALSVPTDGGTDKLALVVLTADKRAELVTKALRGHLKKSLPDYALPNIILSLRGFPLDSNGKVDRTALADLAATSQARSTSPSDPPETHGDLTRGLVHRAWRKFGSTHASRGQGFIHAGGNSLSALRLAGEVEAELGVRLRVRDIMTAHDCCDLDATVSART